jgi:hypothetical protein
MRGQQVEGPGLEPRPSALRWERFALGVVGPCLAVDSLDEGLTILVLLLVFPDLLELLDREAVELPGNLIHGQLLVVRGLQGGEDGCLALRLPGHLLGLTEYHVSLLGGLPGNPESLLDYLLGGVQLLLTSLLGRPQTFLEVREGERKSL